MHFRDSLRTRIYDGHLAICDTQTHRELFLNKRDTELFLRFLQCNGEISESEKEEFATIIQGIEQFDLLEKTPPLLMPDRIYNSALYSFACSHNFLRSVTLELTYRCNLHCKHCYVTPNEHISDKELTSSQWKQVFIKLREMQVMEITLTGGDPFVRDDIFDIIYYLRELGFAVNIYSNAIALTDSDIFRLSKEQVNCFHTSIYSHIPEKHDAVTGFKGSFSKTTDVLNKIRTVGISTNIKHLIMKGMETDFCGMIALAKSLGASLQPSLGIFPSQNDDCNPASYEITDINTMTSIYEIWISKDKLSRSNYKNSGPICHAGHDRLSIAPDGTIYPCNVLKIPLGNVLSDDIADIWKNSEKLTSLRQKRIEDVIGCSDCKLSGYCSFCPGHSLAQNGLIDKKYIGACRRAEALCNATENLLNRNKH